MFDDSDTVQQDDIFDPYATLGVGEHAGPDEITRARNALLREHREALGTSPTVEQTENLRRIIEAHDILADPATRRAYDLGRRNGSAVAVHMNGRDATLSPAWSDMFGPATAPPHWNRPQKDATSGEDGETDNILTRIFGI